MPHPTFADALAEARAWFETHGEVFSGEGLNHEDQCFVGRLVARPGIDGRTLALSFLATSLAGEPFHAEETLIAPATDGGATLLTCSSNLPGWLPHALSQTTRPAGALTFRFASPDPGDASTFREVITLSLFDDHRVGYAFAWGLPGEPIVERSSVLMSPVGSV